MIRNLNVEDIVKILHHEHDGGKCVDLGYWVQWLIQHVNDARMLMLGRLDDNNRIESYIVAMFHKEKISLLYISDKIVSDDEFKDIVLDWANKNFNLNTVSFSVQFVIQKWEI